MKIQNQLSLFNIIWVVNKSEINYFNLVFYCIKTLKFVKRIEGNADDYKCKQKNRYSGILFGMVLQPAKRRVCSGPESNEYPSNKQGCFVAGGR